MSYYDQTAECDSRLQHVPRFEIFKTLLAGKKVLHIGCADWPVFDRAANLHLMLQDICDIDGVDQCGLDDLRPHCKGPLYSEIPFDRSYDVVLIPEVLEHVPNAGDFLQTVARIDAGQFIVTVPCAYQCAANFKPIGDSHFLETVHPDHKCWYSPYTLKAAIRANTAWRIDRMALINHISVMAVCS